MSKGINSLDGVEPRDLYVEEGHPDPWEVTTTCSQPTVTLKNLITGKTKYGAVGSRNMSKFIKLVPERSSNET